MHYAVEYAYGRVGVNHGNRADTLAAFPSADDRDRWVDQRATDNIYGSGYREGLAFQEARKLFGTNRVRDARTYGRISTHLCDGSCR